jgi:hypothetical protein
MVEVDALAASADAVPPAAKRRATRNHLRGFGDLAVVAQNVHVREDALPAPLRSLRKMIHSTSCQSSAS